MRQTLTLLFVITFFLSYSQNTWTVSVYNNGQTIACLGSPFTVKLKFKYTSPVNPSSIVYFVYKADNLADYGAFNIKCGDIYGLPKSFNGTDTIYIFNFNIPENIPIQHYLLYARPITGLVTQAAVNVQLDACVGIEELELNKSIEAPVYYDLMGNEIDKRYNQIIIERVGNNRRKVLIQE
jgi:hypothetical protein